MSRNITYFRIISTVRLSALFAIVAVNGLFIFGCGGKNDIQPGITKEDSADRIMFNAKVDFTEQGKKTGELKAEKLLFFDKEERTFGYKISVDFYNKNGETNARIVADSGWVENESRRLTVFGNVHLRTESGTELWSDSLAFFPEDERVRTNAGVKIDRNGEYISGVGLDSDLEFKDIRIEQNVSGKLKQD